MPSTDAAAELQGWLQAHCACVPDHRFAAVALTCTNGLQVIAREPAAVPTPDWALALCETAVRAGGRLFTSFAGPGGENCHAIGSPLLLREQLVGTCLLVCAGPRPTSRERAAISLSMARFPLGLPDAEVPAHAVVAQAAASSESIPVAPSADPALLALHLLEQAGAQSRLEDAAEAACAALCSAVQGERAAVGWFVGGDRRLLASSDGFHVQDPALRDEMLDAMEEALDDGSSFLYPGPAGGLRLTAAHARLCGRAEPLTACTVALPDRQRPVGALLVTRDRAKPFSEDERTLIEAAARSLGPWLALREEADRSAWRRFADAARARWESAGRGRYRVLALACAVVGLVVFGWPVSAEIVAPVKLEGAVQRIISAPGDQVIRRVAVRPGDMVKAGDVLMEFDVEDLRVERQRLVAALSFAESGSGDALAKNNLTGLAQSEAKAAEARAELALLDQRLERGTVTAPFDGVVIEGDLVNALGAPAKRGEKLMVLAPAQSFRAIVEIPDADITRVREGQVGAIVLTALPDEAQPVRLKRIVPLANVADGRTYFDCEVELTDSRKESTHALRPGMRGIARLEGGRQARGIAWFREARDWLRFAWWRWVG
jgi:hypothetical protein